MLVHGNSPLLLLVDTDLRHGGEELAQDFSVVLGLGLEHDAFKVGKHGFCRGGRINRGYIADLYGFFQGLL